MSNPIDPTERAAPLAAERDRKMAASAQAYVRGSTKRFYERLAERNRALPDAPALWICGDCHLGNLGPVANADGKLDLQIRDLDQTVIGHPAHDLIRLGLSLAMAAQVSALPGIVVVRMLDRLVAGYVDALSGDALPEATANPDRLPRSMRRLLRTARARSWKHLADERIEGTEPRIPLGKRFWPLSDAERSATEALFAQPAVVHLVRSLRALPDDGPVRVLDAAFWRKGCSSLGRLRHAVLVAAGDKDVERHCLIDIKQAAAPDAPSAPDAAMPDDQAVRVATGARALSPHLGDRMLAATLDGKPVFVRALLPQDLKLDYDHLNGDEAEAVAWSLARVLGTAHGRQLSATARAKWARTLTRQQGSAMTVPDWLWDSIVDLVADHSAGYLEHCRTAAP